MFLLPPFWKDLRFKAKLFCRAATISRVMRWMWKHLFLHPLKVRVGKDHLWLWKAFVVHLWAKQHSAEESQAGVLIPHKVCSGLHEMKCPKGSRPESWIVLLHSVALLSNFGEFQQYFGMPLLLNPGSCSSFRMTCPVLFPRDRENACNLILLKARRDANVHLA